MHHKTDMEQAAPNPAKEKTIPNTTNNDTPKQSLTSFPDIRRVEKLQILMDIQQRPTPNIVVVLEAIFSRDVFVNKPLVRIGRSSTPKRRPKKAALSGERTIHHHATQPVKLVERSPPFPSANRAKPNCNRSIDWAHFSIQTEWRSNASGNESATT